MSLVFVDLSFCNWCHGKISATNSKVYLQLNNSGNVRNVMHMTCFEKSNAVVKRRASKIKNPVRGFGNRTGG
jgi:hypothetical protein